MCTTNSDELILYLAIEKLIKKETKKIMSAISDFAAATQVQFDAINANLENITADIANLDKMIQDLKDQLASGALSPEDQAALDAVAAASSQLATKSKAIADTTPDLPPPPPGQ